MPLNVLFVGDVIGRTGRKKLKECLPELKRRYSLDFVIVNGENLAGGLGINRKVSEEVFSFGVDVITTGNHVWRNKEAFSLLDENTRILRPANFPPGNPGKGYGIFSAGDKKICIINLIGRVFMGAYEHPFNTADRVLDEVGSEAHVIIVDFHAEATSEKKALGLYLDGRVSAVLGTHTHVQTADETILPKGTLYITDVGMVGAKNSVIGMNPEKAISGFLTLIPSRFEVAKGEAELNGAVLSFSDDGRGISIERVRL